MPAKAKSVDTQAKRHRKRKSRTEVSSSSKGSSSTSDGSETGQVAPKTQKPPPHKDEVDISSFELSISTAVEAELPSNRQPEQVRSGKKQNTEPRSLSPEPAKVQSSNGAGDVQEAQRSKPADFSAFYLRHITSELAEDLDKIRTASDFTDNALPLLVHALQQGESLFSAEEKRRVMNASRVVS